MSCCAHGIQGGIGCSLCAAEQDTPDRRAFADKLAAEAFTPRAFIEEVNDTITSLAIRVEHGAPVRALFKAGMLYAPLGLHSLAVGVVYAVPSLFGYVLATVTKIDLDDRRATAETASYIFVLEFDDGGDDGVVAQWRCGTMVAKSVLSR